MVTRSRINIRKQWKSIEHLNIVFVAVTIKGGIDPVVSHPDSVILKCIERLIHQEMHTSLPVINRSAIVTASVPAYQYDIAVVCKLLLNQSE